jgi:hypothetical protein
MECGSNAITEKAMGYHGNNGKQICLLLPGNQERIKVRFLEICKIHGRSPNEED